MSIAILCGNHPVAHRFTRCMMTKYADRVEFVEIHGKNNEVFESAMQYGIYLSHYTSEEETIKKLGKCLIKGGATTVVLAWWPHIVHKINKLGLNVINTHPSLLPYNRGKYPYYWAIKDGTPFGATIHRVDDGVDTGTVLWTKMVALDPLDTGESAYDKAASAMSSLLNDVMKEIAYERFPKGVQQDESKATAHHSVDFQALPIEKNSPPVNPFDLVNDLRARTFKNPWSGRRIIINGLPYRIHLNLVEEQDE